MRIRHLVVVVVCVIVAAGGAWFLYSGMHRPYLQKLRMLVIGKKYNKHNKQTIPIQPLIKKNIIDRLKNLEIDESAITVRGPAALDSAIEVRAAIPRGKPPEWILWYLSSASDGTEYRIDDCYCPSSGRECKIRFVSTKNREPAYLLSIRWSSRYYSKTAAMAVIIKDFGFSADRTTIDYLSFAEPLTVALTPSRSLASWTAVLSREYKKEIIILLPMEGTTRISSPYRSSCIMVHYPDAEVRSIIERAVESIPHFSGFGNVSGNRILEDSRVMNIVFSEFHKRHAYFVEESPSMKTLTPVMGKKYGVPFAQIYCSADTTLTVSELQSLIRRCAQEAQRRGTLIIGSKATRSFIIALKNEAPSLRENGVRLSYVSDVFAQTHVAEK